MFTACIHCTADLGRNEAFEAFPVGSRLAFDPAKGRLWVVCRQCDRWNLTPLEERWEAIEDAERRFRDSRLRVSTDNIGLARLKEGVDIIRIGAPQRPEMAAWRYGDQFGRRRNRQMLVTGAVAGSAAVILGGALWVGASFASFAGVYANGGMWDMLINGDPKKLIGKIELEDGRVVDILRRHARMSALENYEQDGVLRLRLESKVGTHILTGDAAMRAAARILPTVNRFGGSRSQVAEAVTLLEEAGDPMRALSTVQSRHGARPDQVKWERGKKKWGAGEFVKKVPGTLHTLPSNYRLALEMALHEESERRAMDGELAELERAWRDAEVIAKISDDMFVTAGVDEKIARLQDGEKPAL